jgi:hypothetical protein
MTPTGQVDCQSRGCLASKQLMRAGDRLGQLQSMTGRTNRVHVTNFRLNFHDV